MRKIRRRAFMRCAGLLLTTTALQRFFVQTAAAETTDGLYGKNTEELKDVLLYVDDTKIVYGSVPKSQKEEYSYRMKTDEEFLRMVKSAQSLPEGPIEYQSYMYKSSVRKVCDDRKGSGAFDEFMSTVAHPLSSLGISTLLGLCGKASVPALAAYILVCTLYDTQNRLDSWWNDALIKILEGKKTCVRYTIVQNIKSEYPKVWRVFELL